MNNKAQELESVKGFSVETIELSGLHSCLEALHLPFGGENNSESQFDVDLKRWGKDNQNICLNYGGYADISDKDKRLIHTLIKRGDEHGKCIRGVVVYAKITAPRYWWQEMDTYIVGVTSLGSNSTMHQQGKGLDTYDLVKMKENLPESTMQTRIKMISYQTLRRIYLQRRNHRLPQWHIFCNWIESLPLAEDFIVF